LLCDLGIWSFALHCFPPLVLLLLLCALLSCYQNLYYPTFHILHVGVNKVCLVFLVMTNNFFFVSLICCSFLKTKIG
jgi:hypothetical protein